MEKPHYVLKPITADEANDLRSQGGAVYVADENPGYPCRQCLRDADIGEELILVSHDPFTVESVYRSTSPIFLHRSPCTPDVEAGGLPRQLTRRQLSVRSFDADEMMLDASVVDGGELEGVIAVFFANEAATKIHIHNATRGCWAVTVERGLEQPVRI